VQAKAIQASLRRPYLHAMTASAYNVQLIRAACAGASTAGHAVQAAGSRKVRRLWGDFLDLPTTYCSSPCSICTWIQLQARRRSSGRGAAVMSVRRSSASSTRTTTSISWRATSCASRWPGPATTQPPCCARAPPARPASGVYASAGRVRMSPTALLIRLERRTRKRRMNSSTSFSNARDRRHHQRYLLRQRQSRGTPVRETEIINDPAIYPPLRCGPGSSCDRIRLQVSALRTRTWTRIKSGL